MEYFGAIIESGKEMKVSGRRPYQEFCTEVHEISLRVIKYHNRGVTLLTTFSSTNSLGEIK